MDQLVEHNFINEERFVTSYTRGKFQNNKWGRMKIRQALRMKGIGDEKIDRSMKKIDSAEYERTAGKLIALKVDQLRKLEPRSRHSKVYYYMMSKGYEADVVIPILRKVNGE